MNSYCTLFDSFYLTRGLALYRSLVRHGEQFQLFILCMDDLAFELLSKMALPHVRLIRLKEFESPDLLAVKPGRTRGEYCWTCTPHILRYCMDTFSLEEVTYLDADLLFFERPSLLLQEFRSAQASILITEHRYPPDHDQSELSGTYCVQFMTFRNDARGKAALHWWQDRCTEWCFATPENGKLGDQKYLDDWTTRFEGVHVLRHLGGGVAPWNIKQYQVTPGPAVDGIPVVFYHYHLFRWYQGGSFDLTNSDYWLPKGAVEEIYLPYIRELKAALDEVRSVKPDFASGIVDPPRGLSAEWGRFKKRIKGKYCVVRA